MPTPAVAMPSRSTGWTAPIWVADDLRIRTQYSPGVVAELRTVPWAWWDPELKAWRVPFRSWEELRRRWPAIETAAQQAEPAERQARSRARAATPPDPMALEQARERRRRRLPVSPNDPPPLGRVLMTNRGAVILTEIAGEVADEADVARFYSGISAGEGPLVWASWRRPTYAELVRAWPSRIPATLTETRRGWWAPTLDELRTERRKAGSIERAQATRQSARGEARVSDTSEDTRDPDPARSGR